MYYTTNNIPRAVQAHISNVKRYICSRPRTMRWHKRHAHRRQRRFLKMVLKKCYDIETYENEGYRGLPKPLSTWDLD